MARKPHKISKEFTILQKILIVLLASLLLTALSWLYSFTLTPQYDVSLSFALDGDYNSDSNVASAEQIVSNLFTEALVLSRQSNSNGGDCKILPDHQPELIWDPNKRVASLNVVGPAEISARVVTTLEMMERLIERDNKLKAKQNGERIAALNKEINELVQPINLRDSSSSSQQQRQIRIINENDAYLSRALIDAQLRSAQTSATINLLKKDAKDITTYLAIPFIASDDDLRGLISSRSLLSQQLAHLEAQLTSKSPQIKAMKAEYKNLNHQIDQKIEVLINEIYNQSFIDKEVENLLVDKLSQKPLLSTLQQEQQQLSRANEQSPSSFELTGLIQQRNKIASENLALMTNPPRLKIIQPLTATQKQYHIGRNYVLLPFIIGLILFSTLMTLLNSLLRNNTKSYLHPHADSKATTLHKIEVRGETITELYRQIQTAGVRRVAVFGNQAENFAARIAIDFRKKGADIVLVDFSGNEIKRYIGLNEGLTDILFGNAHLESVIYKDPNSGVDILSKGVTDSVDDGGLADRMANVIAQLEERYSLVVLAVSEEPFAPLHGFLNNDTLLVITKAQDSNGENDLWIDTLGLAGFSSVILMKE